MRFFIFVALCVVTIWCKPSPSVRIIGGDEAVDTEFPFMAAIWTTTSLGRYFCGGAIIDKKWILTAAHCVDDAKSFNIQLGSVSLSTFDKHRVNVNATDFVIHPDFNSTTAQNNVALIKLPEALAFNDYVNAIALPKDALEDSTDAVALGWGQTDDEHSGPVDVLRKVTVVTLPNEHCKYTYGNQITDNMVCALGAFNEGTCIGDIGGPLVQPNGTFIHIGVASFLSFNGCESIDPSGYERTYNSLEWIKNVTKIS
ncbi:brachyurin [Tribolium castaneum]|uniref:Serine protease H120 n=1 Tax=Tribolium castaneum TaxID=7070 RepID=D6WN61_TRICA|nr:PREDICTED: brachyurin [Tribolium castaneum]EFA04558.1 serine protease H120 [Tribolium castaneum]|eukprot:XP_969435.1 PREDICTED: brachyurin [Tribolium castaneum]